MADTWIDVNGMVFYGASCVGNAQTMLWRTGRKVGRTIYVHFGSGVTDEDVLIGIMDTPELAAAAVEAHNAFIAAQSDEQREDGAS